MFSHEVKNYCQKDSTDSVVKSINSVSLDFGQTLTYLKKLGGHSDATLIILKTRPRGLCPPQKKFFYQHRKENRSRNKQFIILVLLP